MNLTSKTKYALKTLIDIAFHERGGPVQRKHILLRQAIPIDYMDQILIKLKNAGLINSLRGREGGYHMGRDCETITVLDVMNAVEDEGYIAEGINTAEGCEYASDCVTKPAVDFIDEIVKRQLKKYTISMFLEEADDRVTEKGLNTFVILEEKPYNKKIKLRELKTKVVALNLLPLGTD